MATLSLGVASCFAGDVFGADIRGGGGAQAQSGSSVQAWARRLASGNVEFGLRVDGSNVALNNRYLLYSNATLGGWHKSEPQLVGASGARAVVEVLARRLASGNVEFGLQVGGSRIWLPRARYLPYNAATVEAAHFSSPFSTAGEGYSLYSEYDQQCLDGTVIPPTPADDITSSDVDESKLGFNLGLARDCESLLAVKKSLTSDGTVESRELDSWITGRSIRNWRSVTVGKITENGRVTGRVSSLRIRSLSLLLGVIPPEIGDLEHLETLSLSGSSGDGITGQIPPEIGKLRKLKTLSLNSLALSGEIPSTIGNLVNLTALTITKTVSSSDPNRGITGRIPELHNLSKLTSLNLSENKLSGAVPSGFTVTNFPVLSNLNLSKNELFGNLPPGLGGLNLERLELQENSLSGSIPATSGDWASLRILYLHENQLNGQIPAGLAVSSLQGINLRWNELSGPIPSAFASLSRLNSAAFRGASSPFWGNRRARGTPPPGDNPDLTCKPASLLPLGTGTPQLFLLHVQGLPDCS